MNELIFTVHCISLASLTLLALRLGKEALVSVFCLFAILANLFVTKQMICFGQNITCADPFEIGCFLALSFLTFFYGEKTSKQAIWICFLSMAAFALVSKIHLLYLPSSSDFNHSAFQNILETAPRIMLSSIAVCFISQQLTIKLQKYFSKFSFLPVTLKFFIPIAISQLVDTVLFTYLALFGILSHLFSIMVVSFFVKLFCMIMMTPFSELAAKYIKPKLPSHD